MIDMASSQFLRFGFVGVLMSIMHIVFVYVLTDIVGVWYLHSTTISYMVVTVINFFLQKFYVMRNSGTHEVHTQFIKYVVLALLNLGINTASMFVLVQIFSVQYICAQILTLGLVAVFTFYVSRTYIFVNKISYADR